MLHVHVVPIFTPHAKVEFHTSDTTCSDCRQVTPVGRPSVTFTDGTVYCTVCARVYGFVTSTRVPSRR